MTTPEPISDSATGWVSDHIRTYVESNGSQGHIWRGMTTLLLVTRGRKSGTLRRSALIYGEDAGRYLIVASNGAAKNNPAWYYNLLENPEVDLQVGAEKFRATATIASSDEKPRLWKIMSDIFPTYNDYEKKASREIPLVILTPVPANSGD
ncbi:MAG: nitroreductase family deazaflavin-dependent oxidoreductase [Thermomicrobiales bacterium]